MGNSWTRRLSYAAVATAVILVAAYILCVVPARAQPLSITAFDRHSLSCGSSYEANPQQLTLTFYGVWRGESGAWFTIAPEAWVSLEDTAIWINGELQPRSMIAWIPPWDGVIGHEPTVMATVSNLQFGDGDYYFLVGTASSGLSRVAVGSARVVEQCTFTGNPLPVR